MSFSLTTVKNDLDLSLRRLFDLIAPRRCVVCGHRLSVYEEYLCAVCDWQLPRTNFAAHPYNNPVAHYFFGRIPVERAASWLYYRSKDRTGGIVRQAKYLGRDDICRWLGEAAAREFAEENFFEGIDAIVPVPLTRKRRRKRGYNQCYEIARGIAAVTGIKIIDGAVRRVLFNRSQATLRGAARRNNVEGVFRLVKPERLAGKHVLLVDDIVTTGATLLSCAGEVSKAGDVLISIMTICKSAT